MLHKSGEGSAGGSVEVIGFGATQILVDGIGVDLGRRQVKRLVAAFAASGDRMVSADALIDHLWPGELPSHPRKALNVTLSRLRSALGDHADRLVAEGDGYRLVVDRSDVRDFVDAVESSRALDGHAAADTLRSALDAWTGLPFADEPDGPVFVARRQALVELQWYAVTRLTELYVELGEHERAVALSTPFLDDDVARERLVVAHAIALARSGRKSEALAVTGRTISAMRESHGLEPSRSLLAAERDILAGDVDIEIAAPRRARPAAEVFVGRTEELGALEQAGHGTSVVLIAEAGAGKSTLLDRFATDRASEGEAVVRVDVSPSPDRPLEAIAKLCLRLVDRAGHEAIDEEYHGALARLCPELSLASTRAPTREAMIDDTVRFIEVWAASTIVLIDDAHWLDGGSAEVCEHLVRRRKTTLVFGSRPSDDPRLEFLMGSETTRSGGCVHVALGPLTRVEIATLGATMSSRTMDDNMVDRLAERSGGNALFLRLLLDRWLEGGDLDGELPTSVLVSVGERLAALSRPARDTLDIAATIGRKFSIHTLRQLRPNTDSDLESAVAAGLVAVDRGADVAGFVHALVSDVCYEHIAGGRRVSIHEDVGRVLEIDGAPAAEYSRHYEAAAVLDPVRAVRSCLDAAGDFIVGFDWTTAASDVERAGLVAAEFGVDDPDLHARIAVLRGVIGRAQLTAGYVDDLCLGCELARDAGNQSLFVMAVTELCGHGRSSVAGALDQRVEALLDEALSFDTPPAARAKLCAAAAPFFSLSNDVGRGRTLYREAWNIADTLGDAEIEAAVVANAHLGFAHPDDFELLVEAGGRMAQLAGSDAELIWESAFVRFGCAVVLGDTAEVVEAIDEMRLYTPLISGRDRDFGMAFSESAFSCLVGDFEAAEAHADRTLAIGLERFDKSWTKTAYGMLLVSLRVEQGRADELGRFTEAAVRVSPGYLPFRIVAAMIAAEDGDADRARQHLDLITADGYSQIERELHFTAMMTMLAAPVALVGRSDEVDGLCEILLPFSGRMSWNGVGSSGPVDRALARLATARGDTVGAERYRRSAQALVESFHARRTSPERIHNATS